MTALLLENKRFPPYKPTDFTFSFFSDPEQRIALAAVADNPAFMLRMITEKGKATNYIHFLLSQGKEHTVKRIIQLTGREFLSEQMRLNANYYFAITAMIADFVPEAEINTFKSILKSLGLNFDDQDELIHKIPEERIREIITQAPGNHQIAEYLMETSQNLFARHYLYASGFRVLDPKRNYTYVGVAKTGNNDWMEVDSVNGHHVSLIRYDAADPTRKILQLKR